MLISVRNFKPQSPLKFHHTFPTIHMNCDLTVDLTKLFFCLLFDFDVFEIVTCFNLFFHLLFVLEAVLVFDLLGNFFFYVFIKPKILGLNIADRTPSKTHLDLSIWFLISVSKRIRSILIVQFIIFLCFSFSWFSFPDFYLFRIDSALLSRGYRIVL